VTSVKKRTLSLAQLNLELAKLEESRMRRSSGSARAWARLPLF
jgi:hypothetical protein